MSRQLVASKDPAFEEARDTLQKLKKRCQSAQRSLTRFEQDDLPQYQTWLQESFGFRTQSVNRREPEVPVRVLRVRRRSSSP